MELTAYKKLPGSGLRRTGFISVVAGRCKLYLGPDHLLSLDSLYGSETYKRFYFRDIQAFVVRGTPWGLAGTLIFGGLTGISALLIFSPDPVAAGFGVVFTTLFAIIFLSALIRLLIWGGTCRAWVQSAVQSEELPSLNRVRTCRKVLARLQPLILAAQPTTTTVTPATPAGDATRAGDPLPAPAPEAPPNS